MARAVHLVILALIVLAIHSQFMLDAANADSNSSGDDEDTDNGPRMSPAQKTKSINAFKEIVIRSLILSGNPFGHYIGIFAALVTAGVSIFGGPNRDVWSQIESKVTHTIQQYQTTQYFSNLRTTSQQFMVLMQLGDDFSKNDLVRILGQKNAFFPQNHDVLLFNSKFLAAIKTYLLYVTAGYLTLMEKGDLSGGKCQLAYELGTIREEIVMAAKALHRKRYKAIRGTNQFHGCIEDKPGRRIPSCGSCKSRGGNTCNLYRSFRFKDLTSNQTKTEFSPNVERFIFGAAQKETTDMIMELVDLFNDLYLKEDICQEGCEIPERIRRSEVDFKYPTACYESSNAGCVLPCDSYGSSYNWCTTSHWGTKYTGALFGGLKRLSWNECTKPNFEQCMKTPRTAVPILDRDAMSAEDIRDSALAPDE